MELNFIDSLVQGYIVQHLIEHKVQFPEHLEPTLKSFIAAELDELEINHDCPTYDQLESFDFWDNGNANNIDAFDLMSDDTSEDVKEVLIQYTYELVYQKVTENMQCVTIDGEVFYIDEDGTELGLDDIEIYPNANAIYEHMYNLIDIEKIKDAYWDNIQQEDFDWHDMVDHFEVRVDLNDLKANVKITNWEKVKLISSEVKDGLFNCVVQDALTKKYFPFCANIDWGDALEPETSTGLTEEEYLIYCLSN